MCFYFNEIGWFSVVLFNFFKIFVKFRIYRCHPVDKITKELVTWSKVFSLWNKTSKEEHLDVFAVVILRFGYVYFNIFKKFFLFSSLQIVSSLEHNSENEVKQNNKSTANWKQKITAGMINYFTIFYRFTIYSHYFEKGKMEWKLNCKV